MQNLSSCTNDTYATMCVLEIEVQFISDYAKSVIMFVIHVILDMSICVFGIAGNALNITVFRKQGLRNSVNLSLFAISISDLLGLIFQVWQNFCLNPYLELADLPVDFFYIQALTGGNPNVAMTRITGWITMYVTAERCLSVLTPFKVGLIVTFERRVLILFFCYGINLAFFFPFFANYYLDFNFIPELNKTKLGMSVRGDSEFLGFVINVGHIYLTIISFVVVIINTAILVVTLRWKSKWRQSATSNQNQQKALSSREKKTVMLVIMMATVLIACYCPGVVCTFLEIFYPAFGFNDKQQNVFHVTWSFCFLFNSINASINVIVYYKMSSKYRTTLFEIFPRLRVLER
ncbi:thyrotropin-releasing hormone receptor [Biomphalaria glabrata]|nr:thyrotropin-releasing hormone receptor [Biomphalaria glabrata]